jgi:hypothetical protein
MTRAFDIVNGQPVPDVSTLDESAALERKRAVEKRLGEIRGDASKDAEREALKRENAALDTRLREHKEQQKRDSARRSFAGLGSPLHEVLQERLSAEALAELEAAAMRKLGERERRAAERKAAKGG